MPLRPRELVIRAREAATLLLRTLDQNEMVQRFLDMYAAEHRRPGRADQPAHYREQLETIRREAILAMVLRVEGALPKRLRVRVPMRAPKRQAKSKGKKSKTKAARKSRGWEFAIPLLDLFREEFFVALGQALNWGEDDADEFWRDLELYEKLSAQEDRRHTRREARLSAAGPFVDRVAFLLDPSLMEQARRAASKFHRELDAASDRVLGKVLSQRRVN
ncbi:MAG TPA: hypothetical protein VJW93_14830, partial [Candidatus Acidoferrales bacterium]|nr:hypothetical protein [Candidatus Acidoferrales bacterium]